MKMRMTTPDPARMENIFLIYDYSMIKSIICLNSAPNMSAKADPTPAGTTQLS